MLSTQMKKPNVFFTLDHIEKNSLSSEYMNPPLAQPSAAVVWEKINSALLI